MSDVISTAEVTANAAQLIGLDWGSTGLRAFLIGADGQVLRTRSAELGASAMHGAADFEKTMCDMVGDWIEMRPDLQVIACGMVGSKHGWQEVPYAACPSNAAELAIRLQKITDQPVRLVPGVLTNPSSALPDVMRGEETQVIGALQQCPDLIGSSCIITPGTHSKWIDVQDGQICGFATYMTGELFAVLREHSVLGRLIPKQSAKRPESDLDRSGASFDLHAFQEGVDTAVLHCGRGLTHFLFSVRALGVTEKMAPESLADYLSGILIGHEIRAGLSSSIANGSAGAPLALVGEKQLCDRYAEALKRFGRRQDYMLPNTAAAGLWCLAQLTDLLALQSAWTEKDCQ